MAERPDPASMLLATPLIPIRITENYRFRYLDQGTSKTAGTTN